MGKVVDVDENIIKEYEKHLQDLKNKQ